MVENITIFENKRIVLAVTGSIAVYKAVDLASKLTQHGARVDVIMSNAAQKFVSPLTFQSITGRAVYTELWESDNYGGLPTHVAHVGLGEKADVMIIAPATANTLAKLAHGFAEDILTVTALAARCPILIAPAMDGGMYEHPAATHNINTLVERGVILIEPDEGRFASGFSGKGRLPDTETLLGHLRQALGHRGLLAERKIVVTAGGTREPFDPVRYITNRSTGKQGHALAQAAIDAGAEVTLISTADTLPVPIGAKVVWVNSAANMLKAVRDHVGEADALLMAAAVADFQPNHVAEQKIKKSEDAESDMLTLELSRTPDILLEVKKFREEHTYPQVVVGFAAESQDLLDNAKSKLERKGLDLIVANDITAIDAGFGTDTNRVVILDRDGGQTPIDLSSKATVSEAIVKRVAALLQQRFMDEF